MWWLLGIPKRTRHVMCELLNWEIGRLQSEIDFCSRTNADARALLDRLERCVEARRVLQ
jgi:hypothetical protein